VRIEPISGPGVCGAEFPLKVAALGETSGAYGFADDSMRPPADIRNQPRWPISQSPPNASHAPGYPQQQPYPPPQNDPQASSYPPAAQPGYPARSNGPISLTAPGVPENQSQIDLPPDGVPGARDGISREPYPPPAYRQGGSNYPPADAQAYPPRNRYAPPYSQGADQAQAPLPPLGPVRGNPVVAAVGPVEVKPAATLACPIVSVLDRWLDESVQPAAMRWFGARVVAIKQISAYSCRGMNGNPNAHISEHAFGNALDIAAFTLADGRIISVEHGWHGLPEEQGFLRDVQGAACQQFTTVLAPGSNVYHYNHIHVDLMRRATRRFICEPAAVSGQEVAARAAQRNPYASRDPYSTGSLGRKEAHHKGRGSEDDESQDD
jgi:hypothetical protein